MKDFFDASKKGWIGDIVAAFLRLASPRMPAIPVRHKIRANRSADHSLHDAYDGEFFGPEGAMTDAPSLVLLSRWRDQADQAAAAELFERYSVRLIALARKRMSTKLARRTDAEDVVQSACRTFFLRIRDGRLDVAPGSDIWQLLVAITVRKVFAQAEFHTAGKRTVRREDSVAGSGSISLPPMEALASEPSGAEVAAFDEELESILSRLLPVRRKIVELRLQGYSQVEIAEQTGRSERLVRIALDEFGTMLKQRWHDEKNA